MPPADLIVAIAKQAGVYLLKALLVWMGVFLLVALMGVLRFRDMTYPFTIGLVRFAQVLWPCLLAFPVVALILAAFRSGNSLTDLAAPIQWGLKTGAVLFGVAAVMVGLAAVVGTVNDRDPWRYFPGGPPFQLREFASRHPYLRVTDWADFGVSLEDGKSPRVILAASDLREATLNWEKCADASEPARLGGPPPFPESRCRLRITIRRPDYDALTDDDWDKGVRPPELRKVVYIYGVGMAETNQVRQHFLKWARSVGSESDFSGYINYSLDVESGGKKWTVATLGLRRRGTYEIDVEYTEPRQPPKP
jgi:hypothetical protein